MALSGIKNNRDPLAAQHFYVLALAAPQGSYTSGRRCSALHACLDSSIVPHLCQQATGITPTIPVRIRNEPISVSRTAGSDIPTARPPPRSMRHVRGALPLACGANTDVRPAASDFIRRVSGLCTVEKSGANESLRRVYARRSIRSDSQGASHSSISSCRYTEASRDTGNASLPANIH